MQLCLGTGKEKRNHLRRECRKCKAHYQKVSRGTLHGVKVSQDYHRRTKDTPMAWAKSMVYTEVRAGRLPRVSTCRCVDCGSRAQVYDHRDYFKPLEVQPTCRVCNKRRGPGANNGIRG